MPACPGARARVCTDLCVGTYYVGVFPCGRVSKCVHLRPRPCKYGCSCVRVSACVDASVCGWVCMTWCAGVRECVCVCACYLGVGTHVRASTCGCVCVCVCVCCVYVYAASVARSRICSALTHAGTDTGAHGDGRPTPINRCAPMHRSYLRMAGAHRPRCDGRAAGFNRR